MQKSKLTALHNAWCCWITNTLPISTTFFSKTDIPSAFHHQQDLDLVVTLGMCGDSCGGGGEKKRVVGNAASKTGYIQWTVEVWHLQLFNLLSKRKHLEDLAVKPEHFNASITCHLKVPVLGSVHLLFRSIMANNALRDMSRHLWLLFLHVERTSDWS